jgi:UDP-N-acetylglucosamine 2-epimerase (non-hydrolysing)
MKICLIVGTRPEIIKMSPLIMECEKRGLNYFILHTNQHYSYEMDRVFFEDLQLPPARYNLRVGSGTHAKQTGRMLLRMEGILVDESPDIVVVQGDTNTVLAGALAAWKLMMKVGHLEAGLRSFDRRMPEEINRILADHMADFLFAPTKISKENLLGEGLDENKIYVTGNTIVDATLKHIKLAERKSDVLERLELESGGYFLVTLHRQENVDDKGTFGEIMDALDAVAAKYGIPVIFPVHPRTRKMLRKFKFKPKVRPVKPLSYLDFLVLEKNTRLILTDSGGLQEEACILRVPCVTLRENTERPETLEHGMNLVAGTDRDGIIRCVDRQLSIKRRKWVNPLGDGNSGEKIMDIILKEMR